MSETPEYLTTDEAADYLRASPRTLALWRTKNYGPPAVRVGRKLLYSRSEVDAWLKSQEETPTPKPEAVA